MTKAFIMIDIAIIGAGASGLTLATKFSMSNDRVALLSEKKLGTFSHSYKSKLFKNEISGYKGLGGGLNVWGNVCRPLDPEDYKFKSLYPKKKYFYEASKLLNCEFGNRFWFSENKLFDIGDSDINTILSENNINQNIYSMTIPPRGISLDVINKIYSVIKSCDLKNNHAKKIVVDDIKIYSIRLNKNKTYSIIGRCQNTNKQILIKAKKIVMASGTVNNFEIISRSILNKLLPNHNNILSKIGINISDHIQGNIGALLFKKKISLSGKHLSKGKKIRYSFTPKTNQLKGRHGVFLLPLFGKIQTNHNNNSLRSLLLAFKKEKKNIYKVIKEIFKNPLSIIELLSYIFSDNKKFNKFYVWGVFEQKSKNNLLKFDIKNDKSIIDWDIRDQDYEEIKKIMVYIDELFSEIIHHSTKYKLSDLKKSLSPAQHLVGSIPQGGIDGVVNSDFQIIGYENIFCADASIINARGFSNITLTVVANSIALAEKLKTHDD